MNTETDSLPIIDWELAKKLAGNHLDLAESMLAMLVKNLPIDIDLINQDFAAKRYPELCGRVHKLHGAVCYCGTPRLKSALATLEKALKANETSELSALHHKLNEETEKLLDEYSATVSV